MYFSDDRYHNGHDDKHNDTDDDTDTDTDTDDEFTLLYTILSRCYNYMNTALHRHLYTTMVYHD